MQVERRYGKNNKTILCNVPPMLPLTLLVLVGSMLLLAYLYQYPLSEGSDNGPANIQTQHAQVSTLQSQQNKSSVPAKVTPVNCRNNLIPNPDKTAWQQSQKSYIKTQLIDLERQGVSENVLDRVAIDTSIGLFRGRNLRHGSADDLKKPFYYEGEVFFAKPGVYLKLRKQLEAGEFSEIVKSVKAKVYDPNAYYVGKLKMAPLLSFILEFAHDNQVVLIDELIDSGIAVTYLDLVTVTRLNMPEATVNRLYLSSDLQADKLLKKFGKYTSLALLAIQANNTQLARYWINMGSPLQPDLFYDNGLDLLVKSSDGFSQAALDSLFEQMMLKGIVPYWPATYKKLAGIISPTLFNQYKNKLIKTTGPLSLLQLKEVQSIVHRIHTNVLDGVVNFELGTQPEHQCFTRLAKKLTKFAMRKKPKKKPIKHKPEIDNDEKIAKMTIAEQIAKAKNLFSKDQDIEAWLAQEQGLENKQAVESFRRQQTAELAKAFRQQFEGSSSFVQAQTSMTQMYQLANDGKWQEAVNMLNQLDITDEDAITTLLVLALNSKADFATIKQLLDKGAKLL
ncbi:MAG: hypothetical protein ACI8WB_005921, partial [Phenylobacterium sp.]